VITASSDSIPSTLYWYFMNPQELWPIARDVDVSQ
jgi:hypothetical protein